MTEKRYTFGYGGITDNNTGYSTIHLLELCVWLNKYEEENEHLKTKLDYHEQMHETHKNGVLALARENEQLKRDMGHIQDSLWTTDKLIGLEEENKWLKCIIKQLEKRYEDKGFSLSYDMGECE